MTTDQQIPDLFISSADLRDLLHTVLAKSAAFRFKAGGFSMNPFIKDGDIVTVCPLGSTSVRCGDIAAFMHSETNRLLIHRVLAARENCILAKGDNAAESDGLIRTSHILGRVTKIERNGRSLRLGLGCERRLIALFTRTRLLPALLKPARRLYRIFVPIEAA